MTTDSLSYFLSPFSHSFFLRPSQWKREIIIHFIVSFSLTLGLNETLSSVLFVPD